MRSLITTAVKIAFSVTQDMQDSITLTKHTKTVDPSDGSISDVTVSTVVPSLVLPIDGGAVARGEIRAEDALVMKRFLIKASSMVGVHPDYYDTVTHDSKTYSIVSYVTDLATALWTVVGKIQK